MPDTRLTVNIIAVPDCAISTLTGIFETLNAFALLRSFYDDLPADSPFDVEIVASDAHTQQTASGLPVASHRMIDPARPADIVIIPSMLVAEHHWVTGRYPEVVSWLRFVHEQGALLCSACSGVLLLAETGLLDGLQTTIHWAYAPTFRRNFPSVRLDLDKSLIACGEREEFVMSGASGSWHDLVLYLVARHAGPTAAQAIAKFMLMQWHTDGNRPYARFQAPTDHDDALVGRAQAWVSDHFATAHPVEAMVELTGLAESTFKRRFRRATRMTPIAYVQQLRVDDAKKRLERTGDPVDEISWRVGYEDPAFFRRLFKRLTGLTPSAYRRKFQLPRGDEPAYTLSAFGR